MRVWLEVLECFELDPSANLRQDKIGQVEFYSV